MRLADALLAVDRYLRGQRSFIGRIRRALLPWRDAWASARAKEGDRRLAPWLGPQDRPGRRGAIDWLVWVFERLLR